MIFLGCLWSLIGTRPLSLQVFQVFIEEWDAPGCPEMSKSAQNGQSLPLFVHQPEKTARYLCQNAAKQVLEGAYQKRLELQGRSINKF